MQEVQTKSKDHERSCECLHADQSIQRKHRGRWVLESKLELHQAECGGISNLSLVGGQDWMKSTDRSGTVCCNIVAFLFIIYLDLYASSYYSQIQKNSAYFSSSLPKSAHGPRSEFVPVLTWMVSHCILVDPTWPIRHEHQCQCASMFQCIFLCNCRAWCSCVWTLNPEMRGALIHNCCFSFFIVLQVVVLCSTACLGLNANPACDWS